MTLPISLGKPATKLCEDVESLRMQLSMARERGLRVGVVPTMGALHDGHLALVAEAKRHAQKVVVTIFVNPTQFGPKEDFSRYPRDLAGDLSACTRAGADFVFAPKSPEVLYGPGDETRVRLGETAAHLEGSFRPGHFEGVATICTKLFQIVGPSVAVFGRKDYQQLAVIRRLVADLFLPIEIIGYPTHREPDGLAMSSRNRYLGETERTRALAIARGLDAAVRAFEGGERRASALAAMARSPIEQAFDSIDYVSIADADRVAPLADDALVDGRALLAVAARIGQTRLIDNVVLGEDPSPLAASKRPTEGAV